MDCYCLALNQSFFKRLIYSELLKKLKIFSTFIWISTGNSIELKTIASSTQITTNHRIIQIHIIANHGYKNKDTKNSTIEQSNCVSILLQSFLVHSALSTVEGDVKSVTHT